MTAAEPATAIVLRPRHVSILALGWLAAVAWPLATYTVTLAAFGAVHVLSELRYVDVRFGSRFGASVRRNLLVLLTAIVMIRSARQLEVVSLPTAQVMELVVATSLVAMVLPRLRSGSRVVAGVVIGLLGVGIVGNAAVVLLGMAIVHNFTPWCFAAAGLRGAARRRVMLLGTVVFVGLPAFIVSGWPFALLHGLGITAPEATLGLPGPLQAHMPAYLGKGWFDDTMALHAFSACVFLQVVHYLFVVDVLPRSLPAGQRGIVEWPVRFGWLLVVVALASMIGFAGDFFGARGWYGIAAAVHAWIELPVLLLAFGSTAFTAEPSRSRTSSRSS